MRTKSILADLKIKVSAGILCLGLTGPTQAFAAANPPLSSFSFVSLETADLAKAEAFYTGVLGFKRAIALTPADGPVVKVGYNFSGDVNSGEPLLILIHYVSPKPEQNHSSGAKIGFRVPDLKAVMDRVHAAGTVIMSEAKKRSDVPISQAVVRDPDGVIVELVEFNTAQ